MKTALLSMALILAPSIAQADTVKVRYLSGNGDCMTFGASIDGDWTFDAAKLSHGSQSWTLANGTAETRWTHQGHGVVVQATIKGKTLLLESPKWGCKWIGE